MINREFHLALARYYERAPHAPEAPNVKASYAAFVQETRAQFDALTRTGVEVTFTDVDPYATTEELVADCDRGKLRVYTEADLPTNHPFGQVLNCQFRAVHDWYGHYGGKRLQHFPFYNPVGERTGPIGEELAYLRHRELYTRQAWLALTSETRCQTAYNNLLAPGKGEMFGPQKAVDLPLWAYAL